MQSQNLYFVAIIPNGKVAGEITAFKEHIAAHYNSRRALRVAPHITLKAPFKTDALAHNAVCRWFWQLNTATKPFTQLTDGFGAFNNPANPVIYVHPVLNGSLAQLQAEIMAGFKSAFPQIPIHFLEQQFSPHITIGYRDLSAEMFEKAWAEFEAKKYEAAFEVRSFYLLQHDGIKWDAIAEKIL